MVFNWHHSRLDLYWIQSGVNLTPEFLQCTIKIAIFWNMSNLGQFREQKKIKPQKYSVNNRLINESKTLFVQNYVTQCVT